MEREKNKQLSSNMRFPIMSDVRPAKPQTSMLICAVWSEPLLVARIFYDCKATDWTSFWVCKLKLRLHRLVWVHLSKCHIFWKSHVMAQLKIKTFFTWAQHAQGEFYVHQSFASKYTSNLIIPWSSNLISWFRVMNSIARRAPSS